MLIDLNSLPETAFGKHTDEVNVELEYEGFLTPEQLHLLNLLVSGYTYADAARELHISAEACRKRAKRAAQALEEKLRRCAI